MIRRDLGRHRWGGAAALGQIGPRMEIWSIPRDRPFPAALTQVMAGKI